MKSIYLTEERARVFWSKVDKRAGDGECWPWVTKAATFKPTQDEDIHCASPRIAFVLGGGTRLASWHQVRKICDTPNCCNPKHLNRKYRPKPSAKRLAAKKRGVKIAYYLYPPNHEARPKEQTGSAVLPSEIKEINNKFDSLYETNKGYNTQLQHLTKIMREKVPSSLKPKSEGNVEKRLETLESKLSSMEVLMRRSFEAQLALTSTLDQMAQKLESTEEQGRSSATLGQNENAEKDDPSESQNGEPPPPKDSGPQFNALTEHLGKVYAKQFGEPSEEDRSEIETAFSLVLADANGNTSRAAQMFVEHVASYATWAEKKGQPPSGRGLAESIAATARAG